ncbi:heterokaryon incompatibility protein-domain-containing protein, partial [Xylogone sp. PMI_703]
MAQEGSTRRRGQASDSASVNQDPYLKGKTQRQLISRNLGTIGEVFSQRQDCHLCELLAKSLKRQIPKEQIDSVSTRQVRVTVQTPDLLLGDKSVLRAYEPRSFNSPFDITFSFLGSGAQPFEQPIVDPGKFDVTLLRSWLETCRSTHCKCNSPIESEKSHTGSVDTRPFKFRVIDILNDRVIDAPPGCKYVALSYVWGSGTNLTLKGADFQYGLPDPECGGFARLNRETLPQTISDAMSLVEKLGERYLWVDAWCIIQDDKNEMNTIIPMMGQVYKAAQFTIIAASGNAANAGIPGLKPESRCIQSITGTIEGIQLILNRKRPSQVDVDFDPRDHVWGTRCWTFQEWLFSNRAMIFTDQGVFWDCRQSAWEEDHLHRMVAGNHPT